MNRKRSVPIDITQLKGRGTAWAIEHRYTRQPSETFDDGWGTLDQAASEEHVPVATQIIEERVKSILSSNDSPDISFDLSINPYRGCEHVMWRDKVLPGSALGSLRFLLTGCVGRSGGVERPLAAVEPRKATLSAGTAFPKRRHMAASSMASDCSPVTLQRAPEAPNGQLGISAG